MPALKDHPIVPVSATQDAPLPAGLTSDEARIRLAKFGPNAVADTSLHPLRRALREFWAPVPWMLEAAIVLEIVLGKYVEAGIIAVLLVFNAALGFFQEGRAQATLAALKSRLALNASVRRDNAWTTVPAAGLVPGDIVKLSVGGVVRGRRACDGGIGAARSVHAYRRIRSDRSRRRLRNLCRRVGASRRSSRGGHGDRSAHKIWTHSGTGSHCSRRKLSAESRPTGCAQSCHGQWRRHRDAGWICACAQDAAGRDHSSGADGDSGRDPDSLAGYFYTCGGARR